MTSVYATHPRYIEHLMPFRQHPERPERLQAIWDTLDEAGLATRMKTLQPLPAEREWLLAVHSENHVGILEMIARQERPAMIDADTYALPVSYEIARLAAGGVMQTIDAVLTGTARNGLAAVRPPGHHATPDRPMGFCLLNNIAIGASFARKKHGLNRVMIVDFDVHHGNGTQDIFYEDDSVLFISTHQYPFYPGTGHLKETGRAGGRGFTLNIPLEGGHGDKSYAAIFEQVIWPAAKRYRPELILVSAGFDAHHVDPLAMMQLSLAGYAHISRELIRMANELCSGKIVFVLEGGYDLQALGHGVRNIAHALLGEDVISDPYGPAGDKEPDVQPLIEQVRKIHGL